MYYWADEISYQLSLDVPASTFVMWVLWCKLDIGQLHDYLQSFVGVASLQVRKVPHTVKSIVTRGPEWRRIWVLWLSRIAPFFAAVIELVVARFITCQLGLWLCSGKVLDLLVWNAG